MKVLKWILIVLVILAGLVLIVPAFLPATTTLSAEIEIAVGPDEIFHSAALYTDRDQWDPWLKMEPEAKVTIEPIEGYIGSTYKWEGEKIGSGTMRVEEVVFGKIIQSSIWFGEATDSSIVEWHLEKTDVGTHVTWNFIADGKYPFGRLMLMMMSGGMKSSFESGLADMKVILEADPPKLFKSGEIHIGELPEMNTLVIAAEGTMEEMAGQMGRIYTDLFTYAGASQYTVVGNPFSYYLDFDEETGYSHALIGIQTEEKGKSEGDIVVKKLKKKEALMVVHNGKYEFLKESYAVLMKYAAEEQIELEGAAIEIYKKSMMESKNPMDWETVIAFPLK